MSEYDTKVIRKAITVYGWVQGVGFRYRTMYAAEDVGATGWVRNNSDGSVSMEIQGTEAQIDEVFLRIQKRKIFHIHIEKMDVKTIPCLEGEHSFEIHE